jgi:hypothetical protein
MVDMAFDNQRKFLGAAVAPTLCVISVFSVLLFFGLGGLGGRALDEP